MKARGATVVKVGLSGGAVAVVSAPPGVVVLFEDGGDRTCYRGERHGGTARCEWPEDFCEKCLWLKTTCVCAPVNDERPR